MHFRLAISISFFGALLGALSGAIFHPTTAVAQEFRCSKCGKPLVRCPQCGKFSHAAHMPIVGPEANSNGSQRAPRGAHSASLGGFASPQGRQAGLSPGNIPVPTAPPSPSAASRTKSPVPGEAGNARTPAAVSPTNTREPKLAQAPAPKSPASADYNSDVLFHYQSSTGHAINCNGGVVAREKIDEKVCRYGVITARHCIQEGGSLDRREPFGMNYVQGHIIQMEGHNFRLDSATDAKVTDLAFMSMRGSCDAIPESRVAKVASSLPKPGEAVFSRKSRFWGSDMEFRDKFGRTLSYRHESGQLMTGVVVGTRFKGYQGFRINNGWQTRPGDSGAPIYNQAGEMIGVDSHGDGSPPFSEFGYATASNIKDWVAGHMAVAGFGKTPPVEQVAAR